MARRKLVTALCSLALAVGMLGVAAAPASAAKAVCGAGYGHLVLTQPVKHGTKPSPGNVHVYSNANRSKWCVFLQKKGAAHGTPTRMAVSVVDVRKAGVPTDRDKVDAGTFKYYAGPLKISTHAYAHVGVSGWVDHKGARYRADGKFPGAPLVVGTCTNGVSPRSPYCT